MSRALKPQIMCLWFPPLSGPALECVINLIVVVPPSVEEFRKWEENFGIENCSAITRVILFVSEAQGEIGSESTKRMEIACGLPLHIIYQCRVRPRTFFFMWCQECWSPKLSVYSSPQVALPWSGKEHLEGDVLPSVEAFGKWEDNSDSIQFTDCWHCTAVTNGLSAKADIGCSAFS